jgi:hypothetical protein
MGPPGGYSCWNLSLLLLVSTGIRAAKKPAIPPDFSLLQIRAARERLLDSTIHFAYRQLGSSDNLHPRRSASAVPEKAATGPAVQASRNPSADCPDLPGFGHSLGRFPTIPYGHMPITSDNCSTARSSEPTLLASWVVGGVELH